MEKEAISQIVDEEVLEDFGILVITSTNQNHENNSEEYFLRNNTATFIADKKTIRKILNNADSFPSYVQFYKFLSDELSKDYLDDYKNYLKKFEDMLDVFKMHYEIKPNGEYVRME